MLRLVYNADDIRRQKSGSSTRTEEKQNRQNPPVDIRDNIITPQDVAEEYSPKNP